MTGLDNTETTTMIALLLLTLVLHSSALPLPSTEEDNRLFAEVRSAVSNSDVIYSCTLASSGIYVTINDKYMCPTAHRSRMKSSFFMWLSWSFIFFFKQKYLNRFYALPAGLQGRQGSSDAFQTKLKEMQKFFNLKVTRKGKLSNYTLYYTVIRWFQLPVVQS